MMGHDTPLVQTLDVIPMPAWGEVARLKVYTADYRRLNWLEVWQALQDAYPERWALELYPPAEELVNDAHVYHLWLLPEGWRPPDGMNLAARGQAGDGQQQGAVGPARQTPGSVGLDAWRQSLQRLVETGELLQHVEVFPDRFAYGDYRALWDLQRPYIHVPEALHEKLLRRLRAKRYDFFLYEGKLFTIGNTNNGYALMPLAAAREAHYLNRRRKKG